MHVSWISGPFYVDGTHSFIFNTYSRYKLRKDNALLERTSPLELVFFVPDVIGLVVVEELCDARRQVAVDAVHVAGRGHDGAHVFVTVLDTFLHLSMDKHLQLS